MKPAFPKPKDIRRKREAVHVFPDGREVIDLRGSGTRSQARVEYRRRVKVMWERQHGMCCLFGFIKDCPGPLLLEAATFEHETSRGGGKRDDRTQIDGRWINGAAHFHCNKLKGSRRIKYNAEREERTV